MPTVLVAPDSFKGTLSAEQVAAALGDGVRTAGWTADLAPLADGGEGTAAVLAGRWGAAWHPVRVTGPIGTPVTAGFHLTADGRALLDCAAASGLTLVSDPGPSTARDATTAGTGELVAAAVAAGARELLLGVGGSATTDGGRGAIDALRAAGGLRGARLRVLCDVRTSWSDAPAVFGPQKGADPATVRALEARLDALAGRLPRDPRGLPMGGAAGGLAGGLWAAFDAALVAGAPFVLRAVRLPERATAAAAVVTGEGRFDEQSLLGKVVSAVRDAVAPPVHLVVGSSTLGAGDAVAVGFASLTIAGDAGALRAAGAALATPR